ncbi:hypothetical protein [Marinospirillum perlucidum]|uniref:hypothetical protein n=1 Tax=Marinospirillum perlucidum TaxID=1982602 RepID=UPI000DF2A799|nr:hypothetical protein [Marinospirillum perlucidum]
MKMLNRSAISVKLRQPFVDWINSIDGGEEEMTLEEVNQEATIYLVPELEDDEESLEALLEERYLDILENELFSWEEDENNWPEELDRNLFDDFIRIELAFMAFDLDDQAPLMGQVLDELEDLD